MRPVLPMYPPRRDPPRRGLFLLFALSLLSPTGRGWAGPERSRRGEGLRDLKAVEVAVRESKDATFDPEVTRLLETLRTGAGIRDRIDAVKALEGMYPTRSFLDQQRIVDALLFAGRDNDRTFRHYPVAAVGRIGEISDRATATKIARELGQRIRDGRVRTPFDAEGEQEDLLLAFARAGAQAELNAGEDVTQFLDGVSDGLRDPLSRTRRASGLALNGFLSAAAGRLWFERREVFARVAGDLLALGREQDDAARWEIVRTLMLLYAHRPTPFLDDPAVRQRVRDRLEQIRREEHTLRLQQYLDLHLLGRLPY